MALLILTDYQLQRGPILPEIELSDPVTILLELGPKLIVVEI